MRSRPYLEIDVFTSQAYRGNPLAVVADAADLDTAAMQRFANWTNLSETTFLLPPTDPGADYRVRIFTPARELPFAGHPTLGSCHAWLAHGGVPRAANSVIQECAAGLVPLRRDGTGLARARLRKAAWLDNGPRWLALLLDSAETVLSLDPNHAALGSVGLVGLIGPVAAAQASAPDGCNFEVRAFAAADGIPEDPVTGSLNAALGQWLTGAGLAPPSYRVSQGTRLQRAGRVQVQARDGDVWIGGQSLSCVQGSVLL
jgi:predicted PhzF superfamily epimerase YddE/YHI9